jgi:hypothetical protein
MDRQDLQFEKLVIAESVRLPLHGLDLVVRPLKGARANREIVVGEQARSMRLQRVGHLTEHVDS